MNKNKVVRTFVRVSLLLIFLTLSLLFIFIASYCIKSSLEIYKTVGYILYAFSLLFVGWIIVSISYRIIKRKWVVVTLLLLLYGLGVYAYQGVLPINSCSGEASSWIINKVLAPVNHTLSIFFPSRGSYAEGDLTNDAIYQTVHLLSYLFFAIIAFSLFGKRIINRTGYIFIPRKYKNVFWGLSSGSYILGKDIINKSFYQQIIFLLPHSMKDNSEEDKRSFEEIDKMGGIALYKDLNNIKTIVNAKRHFFLTEDQDYNITMSLRLIENLNRKKGKKITHIYIRTEVDGFDEFLTKKIKELNNVVVNSVEIHIVNQSAIIARKLLKSSPILEMPKISINKETAKVNGHFNILQLGLGWTGIEILNKTICNSQFLGSEFSATIFDKNVFIENGLCPLLDTDCKKEYGITLNPAGYIVGSKDFYVWIYDNIELFNRIIVSLGNDLININIGLNIAKILKEKEISKPNKYIFVYVGDEAKFNHYKKECLISVFGNLSNIYTEDLIINEELDSIAKQLNFSWVGPNKYKNPEEAWHDINIFSQESSRAAAEAISNTLKLLGMTYVSSKNSAKKNIVTKDKFTSLVETLIETLAENEHKRWNAFHFTKGVKKWDFSQVDYDKFVKYHLKGNQVSSLNKHAALLPYNQIPNLDKTMNEFIDQWNKTNPEKMLSHINNQKYDRIFINKIPEYLSMVDSVMVEL